jgi:Icc-related predicted phosphoesterase
LTTLYFATDIHGSQLCWNKFINAGKFYKADVIILGGDLTGKAIVPIVHQGNNTYRAVLLEHETILHGEDDVIEMERRIRSRGYYPYRTNPDEISELNKSPEQVHSLFVSEVLKTAETWLTFADKKLSGAGIRCFVAPGNDDMFEIDELIRKSKYVELAEGMIIDIDDQHEMLSSGWSNITPWHTFREESEDKLLDRFQKMATRLKNPGNSIFSLHVPPFASTLDEAPELTDDMRPKYAGNSLVPVGSKSVRKIIEENQPLLGLFGHIHESRGATRIGKTLCINPGSMYEQGILAGVLIKLAKGKVKNYVLTSG